MKRKDYIILLIGILLIVTLFTKYEHIEFLVVFVLCITFLFFSIYLLFLIFKEKNLLKNGDFGTTHVYTCCFINDDINFNKFCKLLSEHYISSSSDVVSLLEELTFYNVIVKIKKDISIDLLISKINGLLGDFSIDVSDILKFYSKFISDRRKKKQNVVINDLNFICKLLRSKGLELVQFSPLTNRNSKNYYFGIIPFEKLIDLNQIGLLR